MHTPYSEGLVSLPPAGASPADPAAFLRGEDLDAWEDWSSRICLPPLEAEAKRLESPCKQPHSDNSLIHRPARYGPFVRQLMDAGACELGPLARHTVGVFS